MRILMALAVVALLSATVTAQTAPVTRVAAPIKPLCQNTQRWFAQSPTVARVHPMTQEPNASEFLAVLRTERGCSKPVIVREDIGTQRR